MTALLVKFSHNYSVDSITAEASGDIISFSGIGFLKGYPIMIEDWSVSHI